MEHNIKPGLTESINNNKIIRYYNGSHRDIENSSYSFESLNIEKILCETPRYIVDYYFNFYVQKKDTDNNNIYYEKQNVTIPIFLVCMSLLTIITTIYNPFKTYSPVLSILLQLILFLISLIYLISIIGCFISSNNDCYLRIINSNVKNNLIRFLNILFVFIFVYIYYAVYIKQ